jgi:hypothetical protein
MRSQRRCVIGSEREVLNKLPGVRRTLILIFPFHWK